MGESWAGGQEISGNPEKHINVHFRAFFQLVKLNFIILFTNQGNEKKSYSALRKTDLV